MNNKISKRAQSESGFTLVELLVVMLIIGLLAAIAIPAFFNQRSKATDASAKEAVRTMQTAIETYSTDNGGGFTGATLDKLHAIEPTVPASSPVCGSTGPCAKEPSNLGTTTYTVTFVAKTTNNTFSITRNSNGTLTYPCTVASGSSAGGCANVVSGTGSWN